MGADSFAAAFKTYPATKLKSHAGELIDHARSAPVLITNHGRKTAYIVSVSLFDRLMELEDAQLIVRAQAAIDGGVLNAAESLAFLKGIQGAKPAAVARRAKGAKPAARKRR